MEFEGGFFHCQNQGKICNNITTKDPIAPQVCRTVATLPCEMTLTNGAINETLRQFAPLNDDRLVDCRESSMLIDHLLKGTPNSVIDWIQVPAVWGHMSGSMNVTFSRRRYVSVFFIELGANVNSKYYCQHVLGGSLLPDIHVRCQHYSWTLQQDCALSHTARNTLDAVYGACHASADVTGRVLKFNLS